MSVKWKIAEPDGGPPRGIVAWVEAGVEMAFRLILPPERGFQMGSRGNFPREEPRHLVVIPHAYWMAETPVTQAQFALWTATFEPEHKNSFPDQPDNPAENMNWRQAGRFCRWLTEQMAGQFPAGVNLACLPTEAEWEYACRAGTETDYHTGDGEAALSETGRFSEDYDAGTRPVRRGAPNAHGLHDLHGHVWQWCHDVWGEDYETPRPVYRQALDGEPDAGAAVRAANYESEATSDALLEDSRRRVVRGGSWVFDASDCRSAFRDGDVPGGRFGGVGFRVCLAPGPAAASLKETEKAKAKPGAGDGGRGTSPESDAPGAAGAGGHDGDWGKVRLPPAQPAEK